MKWGIIGAGRIAHRFASSLKHVEGCTLQAVSCRTLQKAEIFQTEHDALKAYGSFDAIVNDPQVEAVYISTPHQFHYAWIMKCLQAHKAVLVEKPACLSAEEMQSVIHCAKENHCLFMEAMKCRFTPLYEKVKEVINEDRIGKITQINTSFCNAASIDAIENSYLGDPASLGCLSDLGIYCISWIEDFTKEDMVLKYVYANVKNCVNLYICAYMQSGDIACVMECGMDREKEKIVTIKGTKGTIVVRPLHRAFQMTVTTDVVDEIEIPYVVDDFYGEIKAFVDCYQQGNIENDYISHAASLRCTEIMEMIQKSLSYDEKTLLLLEKEEKQYHLQEKDIERLGNLLKENQKAYDRTAYVRVYDEVKNAVVYEYIPEGKEKNVLYITGKRNVMLKTMHSSFYAYVEHELHGTYSDLSFPEYCLSAGAFPIFENGVLRYAIVTSGMHEGQDHALIVQCLSQLNDIPQSDFPYRIV